MFSEVDGEEYVSSLTESLASRLEENDEKIIQVLAENERLRKDNKMLKRNNHHLWRWNVEYEESIAGLEVEIKALKKNQKEINQIHQNRLETQQKEFETGFTKEMNRLNSVLQEEKKARKIAEQQLKVVSAKLSKMRRSEEMVNKIIKENEKLYMELLAVRTRNHLPWLDIHRKSTT